MCGIVGGIQNYNQPEEKERKALQLINTVVRMGIDLYEENSIWLGHARLSIQDLSVNGSQP